MPELRRPRDKKCKVCRNVYLQFNSTVAWCSPDCGLALLKIRQDQKYKKKTVEMKREWRGNNRSYQVKKAQDRCNEYIKKRDKDQPCIDCGRYEIGRAKWHAGHFKTRGAYPELQYHESNIHKQCSQCNKWGKNGTARYRLHLVDKIGIQMVEFLEGPQQPQNWSLDDIKDINEYYKVKINEISEY